MADITNKNLRIPGVNQDTAYIKQRSYLLDGAIDAAVLATGTHSIIALPKGEAVTKLRLVAIDAAASGGSATVQFKVAYGQTAEAINSTAVAVANLGAGDVYEFPVNGVKGYDAATGAVLQMTVGTAALTAAKFLLIVETLPVNEFMTMG